MPLSQRLIAKLLIEDGVAVKYRRFTEDRRIVGDPVALMKTLEDQVLDEFNITFLGDVDPVLLARMTESAFCPVTVAGSIRTLDTVHRLIRECGVEKIVTRRDDLGWDVAAAYGAQAAVFPVDYTGALGGVAVPAWAGEVLLTSIDRDGTGAGFDLDSIRREYKVPVVVAGGCGKLVHVKEALEAGASGVCVSSMFAFSDKSPVKLRTWLVSQGCDVRPA